MNDNFENKTPEKGKNSNHFAKKIAKFSAFIYLALAITVVIVATVGIFSVSYDYESSIPEISLPSLTPEVSEPHETVFPDLSESPVVNEQSGIDADTDEPTPETPSPVFFRPVKGEIIKAHSLDKLVFSETMRDYRVHKGIDIAAEAGTEVVAFTDGKVSAVTEDYFYGTTVAVTHDSGLVSYYMNLDPELASGITVGATVKAGDVIGKIGSTARLESADESHLHFELTMNGEIIDPTPELP
jgi:murein DD-endopeptidase MepM/ murein hydrolase activator NlpD